MPFYPPGDQELANAVGALARDHHSIRSAHHGAVVAGKSLASVVDAVEELEETAKLYLMLRNTEYRTLTDAQVRQTSG